MFCQYVYDGILILKSVIYFEQADTQTRFRTDDFIFRNQILAFLILESND